MVCRNGTLQRRAAVLLLLGLAALLPACEDPQAQERTAVAEKLEELTAAFTRSMAGAVAIGSDAFVAREVELQGLASQIASLRTGDSGLSSAQASLGAAVHSELAAMSLDRARSQEQQLGQERLIVAAMGNAMRRLQDRAAGRRSLDFSAPLESLQSQKLAAQDEIAKFGEVIVELDAPIAKLTGEIEVDRAEVDRLAINANGLRREASELGAADGFSRFQQAVEQERQADRIENRIAHREIDLDYELLPDHRMAETLIQNANTVLAAAEQSQDGLEAFAALSEEDLSRLLAAIQALSDQVQERLAAMDLLMSPEESGSLADSYRVAEDELEEAAAMASRAASRLKGEEGAAARVTAARIQTRRGELLSSKARGLSDASVMLSQLVGVEEAMDAEIDQRLAEIDQQKAQALQDASAAFSEAKSVLSQVQSRPGSSVAAFGASIDVALGVLSGAPVSKVPAEAGGPGAAASPSTGPESVLARLRERGDQDDALFFELCHASTPTGEQAIAALTRMAPPMARLEEAMKSQYGKGLAGAFGGAVDPTTLMAQLENATLVEESDQRAVYRFGAEGQTAELPLIRVGSSWFIDFERFMPVDASVVQMLSGQAQAFEQLVPPLVQQIQAGEFGTLDEAMQAFQQALAASMMKAPPGGQP